MDAGPAPDNVVAVFMHRDDHRQRDHKGRERHGEPAKLGKKRNDIQVSVLLSDLGAVLSARFRLHGLIRPYPCEMVHMGDGIKGDLGINEAAFG